MSSFPVLVDAHLLRVITSFQDGVFVELLPLYAAWKSLAQRPSSLSTVAMQPTDLSLATVADSRYVLHAVVACHDVSYVDRVLQCCRQEMITPELIDCAARHGHLDLVQQFHFRGFPWTSRAMDLAATYGHLHVLEFLHAHSDDGWTEKAMIGAAEAGHLAVVQFLHTTRPEIPSSFRAMDYAARNGHYNVVRYLHFHRPEGGSAVAMDFAASHGHLEIVQFLHTHRQEGCSTYAMDGAMRNGHHDVVRFLHTHRTEGCSRKALMYAMQHELHDMIPILRSYHGTMRAMSSAAVARARAKFSLGRPLARRRYFLASIAFGHVLKKTTMVTTQEESTPLLPTATEKRKLQDRRHRQFMCFGGIATLAACVTGVWWWTSLTIPAVFIADVPLAPWTSDVMEPPFIKETNLIRPKLIAEDLLKRPVPTNAWWTNLLISDSHGQNTGAGQVTLSPYTIASWPHVMQVSYGDDRRVEEPSKIEEYFSADLTFGTVVPSVSRQIVAFDPLTVHLQYRNESNGTTFTVLLARGSPYISINYTLSAPVITTTYFNMLRCNNQTLSSKTPTTLFGTMFTLITQMERQKTQEWLLFFPKNVTVSVNSTSFAVQDETFSGIVRAAIVPRSNPEGTAALLRQHASIVPVASAVTLSSNDTTGIMEFTWKTAATTNDSIAGASLLMLAHPHHVDSLVSGRNRSLTTTVMHSSTSGGPFASSTPSTLLGQFGHRTIKGNMSLVVGNSWRLADTFQEVGFHSQRPIATEAIMPLLVALKNDSNYTPHALDPYFFGKEVARQARLVLIADELNQGTTKLLDQLEDLLLPWFVGKNIDYFVYDTVWGGVCSVKGLRGVFWMTDFGNGWYNDHHFHYGYFIYAAAVVAKYRPAFVLRHRAVLMSIVRDIANNSPHDPYFPLARHMSWFDGHSFASGVYVLDGGKSQESVSEAINAYYAVYLLGQALEMPMVEKMGRHLMTLEMRAATTYWQTTVSPILSV
ncbi:hypothetical protein, variant [Aphanomyces invadans]|uniref:glucan endo-1,3-beta-D-glucosidase n=1 Tax=Aphanomyces invadans TaxID=157072 RepID=A0A024TY15_9STRA|nr:hypothetical protein, variant [Aphanomyces invadans]ETV98521.1 hypothetical protein, variant [Aphanomyces invadans]|eukprot:XP_008872718.1 hypothetical protein, variant [Aphanomyces invadans]